MAEDKYTAREIAKEEEKEKTHETTKKVSKIAAQAVATYYGGQAAGTAVSMINNSGVAEPIYDRVSKITNVASKMAPGGRLAQKVLNKADDEGLVDMAGDAVDKIGSGGAGAAVGKEAGKAAAKETGKSIAKNTANKTGFKAKAGEYLKNRYSGNNGEEKKGIVSDLASKEKDKIKQKAKQKAIQFILRHPWLIAVFLGLIAILLIIFIVVLAGGDEENENNVTGFFDPQYDFNNTKVNVTNCYKNSSDKIVLQTLSMEDYILGVVYAEIDTGYNVEAIKTQMIAAKTFAMIRGKYESTTKEINIKTCNADQAYCDIYAGCYKVHEHYYEADRVTYVSYDSNYVFNNSSGMWKPALSSEKQAYLKDTYSKISSMVYINRNFDDVLTSYTQMGSIGYLNHTQELWNKYASEGYSYEEILEKTGSSTDSQANHYKDKAIYDMKDHLQFYGSTGEGEFEFEQTSDGSVNVNKAPRFISQAGPNLTFNHRAKNGKSIGTIYLQDCSCGPTSVTMIAYALGNISYLDQYFMEDLPTGDKDVGRLYAGLMHVYMYDLGVNGNPNRTESHCGGISSQASNKTLWSTLSLKVTGTASSTGSASKILSALRSSSMVIYNIGTYTNTALGNTSGGHFGVIYGYDASDNTFLVHNPGRSNGGAKKVSYSDVDAYVRNATFVSSDGSSTSRPGSGKEGSVVVSGTKVATYTASNGRTYRMYKQSTGPWASGQAGSGTISQRGCLISAMANIMTGYGIEINPKDLQYSGGVNISSGFNKRGLNAKTTSSLSAVKEHLKQGNEVLFRVWGYKNGGSSEFTTSQHYMALVDISSDGNSVYVLNSSKGADYSGWINFNKVMKSVQSGIYLISKG